MLPLKVVGILPKTNPSLKEDQEEIRKGHSHLLKLEPTVGTERHCCPLCTAGSESTDTAHKSIMAAHGKLELSFLGFSSCGMETHYGCIGQLML